MTMTTEASAAEQGYAEIKGSEFSARIYEPFLWLGERRGMRKRRRDLLRAARGRVLEVGAGTGLNLEHYGEAVEDLTLTEPVAEMASRIEAKRQGGIGPGTTTIVTHAAEALPFEDDSFDTVVSTMVLCTVADLDRALDEIARVLAPEGRLLFCEHVRADGGVLAGLQDRLAGPWAAFAEGCQCNRDTIPAIETRFEITTAREDRWRGMPALVRPLVIGEAVAR
jgi:SAM-dependent methyltransferase